MADLLWLFPRSTNKYSLSITGNAKNAKRTTIGTGMEVAVDVVNEDTLDWARNKAAEEGHVLLLQFGNSSCIRCPAFSEAIEELKENYTFMHCYCDTHLADDLLEEYGVTNVPSIVIFKEHMTVSFLNCSIETLKCEVKSHCSAILKLEEDF